ncbi:MAG: trypsin-like peptidase domain-containing protein [Candidatus Izimaplasma sp.]|nr:trypsin-like peptidase domain-containing protein [Candidatus Izimaplasma bacterium]
MKKLILILTISFSLILAGCTPPVIEEPAPDALTEEELIALIEGLIPEVSVDTTYDLTSFQEAVTDMLDVARHGIIGIISNSETGASSGSGVIYKQVGDIYYVVTNHHVLEDSTSMSVVYEKNGVLFEISNEYIEILGSDPTTDLAVFTFESTEYFAVISIGDSYDIEIGDFVFAIGNPLGFEYYGTVTMGIVSGLTRYVTDGDFNATLLQHDAAISPGNSGGALLNINGELIGINNMKIIEDYVSGIRFAIPSNTVRRITMDLEDDGIITRPYLGITTYAQLNVCGTEYGVCIAVQAGGAAEAAGLQDGDTIVGYKNSTFDTFRLILNFNDLKEAILNSQVGEEIQLQYIRDGVLYTSDIATLGTHPDD